MARALHSPARRSGAEAAILIRRGVRHGLAREGRSRAAAGADLLAEAPRLWREARPILVSGILCQRLDRWGRAVRSSRALFERLRRGASFQDEVWRALGRARGFEPAGTTVDLSDAREIEKVFAHARRGGRARARDLYAKLSWVSHDPRDASLRIRFSFGSEHLLDWQRETARAPWADRLAEALFPECAALTGSRALVRLIERCAGRRVRFSERIVYSNAPGGGAVFHHDAEPRQLGVVYAQLAGETGWLALPKRDLAGHAARFARSQRSRALRRKLAAPAAALRALDGEDDRGLLRLLNHTPAFTRVLVAAGAFLRLRPGDALLLPSPGFDDCCWHSVFALGRTPSLSHSYGIHPVRPTRSDPVPIVSAGRPP